METLNTQERSKPVVPPKPASLAHPPNSHDPDSPRKNVGNIHIVPKELVVEHITSEFCHFKSSTTTEVTTSQTTSSNSLKNINIVQSSKVSLKPPILPKPEHLKNFKSPVHSKQTSPISPKKLDPKISHDNVISNDNFSWKQNCHENESKSIKMYFSALQQTKNCTEKYHSESSYVESSSNLNRCQTILDESVFQGLRTKILSRSNLADFTHEENSNSEILVNIGSLSVTDDEVDNIDQNHLQDLNKNIAVDGLEPSLQNLGSNSCNSENLNEILNLCSGKEALEEKESIEGFLSEESDDSSQFQVVLNDVPVRRKRSFEMSPDEDFPRSSTPLSDEIESKVEALHLDSVNQNYTSPTTEKSFVKSASCFDVSKGSRTNYSDIDSISSDVSVSYSVRRKFSNWWFGSFGKGYKLRRAKRESCTFYNDDAFEKNDTSSDGGEVVNSAKELDDVNKLDIPVRDNGYLSDKNIEENRSSISDESLENEFMTVPNPNATVENHGFSNEPIKTPEERMKRKAFLVAKEIMTSEKVFIDALKIICIDFTKFIENAESESFNSIIPLKDLQKVIGFLPQLLQFNENLVQDFENRVSNWDKLPKIADIIVKKGPFLKLYSSYILSFEQQCEFLNECRQKYPRFAKVLKDFETSHACKKLNLEHYMLKPVQRIPQYRLLLENYLSCLESDSEDFEDTKKALHVVCDVANHANKSLKQEDHLSKLLQIQAQLGNYQIVKPGREFIKGGELYKLSRKDLQLRYLILLNDCLITTSYYGSMLGLKVNHELPLCGMKVCVPQTEDYHNEFSIKTITRSFSLRARSSAEREEWILALEKAINEKRERQKSFIKEECASITMDQNSSELAIGKEAPIWIPDSRVTMCQSCTGEFTVTFRRHHCRACGKVVCKNCSDNKAPLQYKKFEPNRVCDDCYKILINEFENPSNSLHDALKRTFNLNSNEAVEETAERVYHLFKKVAAGSSRKHKYIPQRLKEVTANDTGSQMSGWLFYKEKRTWKHRWFVLKEQVLYVYKASEDVLALESIPVLGYHVRSSKEIVGDETDSKLSFQLTHPGQRPLNFSADNPEAAERWKKAFSIATVLSSS